MLSKFKILNFKLSKEAGQSIIEIVIALAIFIIIVSSLTILALSGFSTLERGREFTQAGAIAREGIEAIRSIRDRDWDELAYDRSAVATSSGQWILSGEGTTEIIGNFTRVIDFYSVYRDGSDNIVGAGDPGATEDASSTRIVVGVTWEIKPGVNNSIKRITYLTNWRSN